MTKFGDTAGGVWLMEVLDTCVRELSEDRWSVDMNHLVRKCLAEPKNAQIAMQLLAQELRTKLGGKKVADAPKEAWSDRLLLGWIYLAYAVSRDVEAGRDEPTGEIPDELKQIVRWNPEIIHSANYVSAQSDGQGV